MNETAATFGMNTSELEAWESQDTLSTYQIITFIWSILCTIPNAILIHILSKEVLRQSAIYFTLLNWSICNIVLILSTINWTVVPLKYLSFDVWQATYSFTMSFVTLTVILVTIFTYEKYIQSKDISRYVIFRFWMIVGILVAIGFVSAFVEYVRIILVVFSFGIINLICFIILSVKVILFCIKNNSSLNDTTYSLRLTIALIYVSITFLDRCFFVAGYHWMPLFEFFKIVIFTDGFLNLSVIVFFDERIKNCFLRLFKTREILNPI